MVQQEKWLQPREMVGSYSTHRISSQNAHIAALSQEDLFTDEYVGEIARNGQRHAAASRRLQGRGDGQSLEANIYKDISTIST